ncbi:hypothetical protein E8E13_005212 [Curvularia kusanoi]|uniref:Uncharacterized protein n=1 Tax=Curvularia kusanoi TaxID=90978 RepID=A0A9P4W8N5_CURKU|nr:hypothetical protein E8E13_005212 [Curvularia kusanoi]
MGETENAPLKRALAIGDEPVVLKETQGAKPVPQIAAAAASQTKWNTEKLGLRVGSDALAAGAAGALVAPIITIIDKGIIENASGRNPLGESLKKSARELLLKPHRFLTSKPFALIFVRRPFLPHSHRKATSKQKLTSHPQTLYFGTYFTANSIDTISSTRTHTPFSSTTAGTSKFAFTSSSNLALCLYKDNKFTQLFGSTGAKRPVPLPTFALFTVRDCLTIFASFNLPPLFAPKLEEKMGEEMKKYVSGISVAQFATPAAIQLVSTPLHLLGLDLYNRPGVAMTGKGGRVETVVGNWAKSAAARICRIVPAFGVGGVVNTKVRKGLMGKLEE